MKKYILPITYRGVQVHKSCCCKSDKEAAKIFNVSLYYIRQYAYKTAIEKKDVFEGMIGYIDSGLVIFKFRRIDLNRKELPIKELESIIDIYTDKYYSNT